MRKLQRNLPPYAGYPLDIEAIVRSLTENPLPPKEGGRKRDPSQSLISSGGFASTSGTIQQSTPDGEKNDNNVEEAMQIEEKNGHTNTDMTDDTMKKRKHELITEDTDELSPMEGENNESQATKKAKQK